MTAGGFSGGHPPFLDRFGAAFGGNQALLLKFAGLSSPEVEASGAWVRDSGGTEWMDLGSFGVHLLGHRHPAISAAATRALATMSLSTKILSNEPAVRCAEQLIALCGFENGSVIFSNSGSEAVEAAIRLSSSSTDRSAFAALTGAYHGKTLGASALTDSAFRAPVAATALPVLRLPSTEPEAVGQLIDASPNVAAVFVEPVQGEGGVHPITAAVRSALRSACDRVGALLVVDEIQTGLGRTGPPLAAGPRVADIVLFGKVLGGGQIPVAATVFNRDVISTAAADPVLHSSTFAGSPLATGVASAVIDAVTKPDLETRVEALGGRFIAGLTAAAGRHDLVADVRGRGLMLGIEFHRSEDAGEFVVASIEREVLVTFCLNEPRVVRIYPPVCLSTDEADWALDRLTSALDTVADRAGSR